MKEGWKLALIGSGFMGGALLRGLVKSGRLGAGRIIAADPREEALKTMGGELGVRVTADNAEAAAWADVVLFAVKPQLLEGVVKSVKSKLGRKKLVISIAAGVPVSKIELWLPAGSRVVRAMPNMAAAVGESATAICAGAAAGDEDMETAKGIFEGVGGCVVVDEPVMDAVTGLAGSGPAFVFAFLEGMIDAGVRCGLSRNAAKDLAERTLYGAAKMALETGEHPAVLKDRITSPGGTTIAGLAAMEKAGFKGIVIRAVEAAVARSKELGGG